MSVKINIVEGSVKRKKFPEEKALPSMEAVHHPDDRPWIGEKINLNEHFSIFSKKVESSRVPGNDFLFYLSTYPVTFRYLHTYSLKIDEIQN